MDFNNYIQPNIAARGAAAQEGIIIVDIVNKITQFNSGFWDLLKFVHGNRSLQIKIYLARHKIPYVSIQPNTAVRGADNS